MAQFIDTKLSQGFPLSYARSAKTLCLKLVLTHFLNFFIVTKSISD